MAEDSAGRRQRSGSIEFKVTRRAGSRPTQNTHVGANVGPQREGGGAAPNIIRSRMRTRRRSCSASASRGRDRHDVGIRARAGQSRGGLGRVGRDRSGSSRYSRRSIDAAAAAAAAAAAETKQDAVHVFRRGDVRVGSRSGRCAHAPKGRERHVVLVVAILGESVSASAAVSIGIGRQQRGDVIVMLRVVRATASIVRGAARILPPPIAMAVRDCSFGFSCRPPPPSMQLGLHIKLHTRLVPVSRYAR